MRAFKFISAAAAAVFVLTASGCGDTSAADKIIGQQNAAGNAAAAPSETSSDDSVSDESSAESTADGSGDTSSDYLLYVPDTSSKSYAEGIDAENEGFDVDLTILNPTMTYSQVYDMMTNPDMYIGKKVRARGNFAYTSNEQGTEYFAVLISDATACCSQGIEFVLKGDHKYPDDYPPLDTEITVWGTFTTYQEGTFTYIQLQDAEMSQ